MPARKRSGAHRARQAPADVYQRVFESLPHGLKVWRLEDPADPGSLRLIASNAAAAEATGVPLDQVMGRTMAEAFPQAVPLGIAAQLAEVALSGKARDLGEVPYGDARMREGVFAVFAFPLPDRCVGVAFENITREKLAEAARVRRDALETLAARILEGGQRERFLRRRLSALFDGDMWLHPVAGRARVSPRPRRGHAAIRRAVAPRRSSAVRSVSRADRVAHVRQGRGPSGPRVGDRQTGLDH
ncbi:MAG: PAS domain-containing protein [Gemmatimonadetes bacterium]|nr:PAS domain-containing protein [Gemmatimonadota bacterium]